MSRPKDADSTRTIQTIIDTALALLAEDRDGNTPSLRAVAQRAGVSPGTIQYYFDNKEELLEACLDGYYVRLAALGQELIAQAASGSAGRVLVEDAARSLYRFSFRERGLVALRLATNAKRGELHPRRQPDFMGAVIGEAAKVLAPHVEVDELDTRLAVQGIASIIVRFALLSDSELHCLTGLDGAEARTAAEEYVVRAARRLVRPGDG